MAHRAARGRSTLSVPGAYISRMIRNRTVVAASVCLLAAAACSKDAPQKVAQAFQAASSGPDEVPKMLNTELPFRYPAALYARKVQGNVTLRLRLDRDGAVLADSTTIEEKSGYPALDSAALKGSQELRFVPAKLKGEAMPVTILFPVYFRHPEGHPLPGDTILTKQGVAPVTMGGGK
jgi:TonB family protein